ncbi:MAG: kelch repeat-containing protein [Chloroflexota bacterium]
MIARSGLTVVVLALLQVACGPQPSPATSDSAGPSSSTSPDSGSNAAASPPITLTGWSEQIASGPAPAPREDHTWTITPDDATAYLFGGRDLATVYDDFWAYSLATGAWSRVTPAGEGPPGRFGHNAAWADGIGLVIFGGQAGADFFNDLWAYDPATDGWRLLPASGAVPVARYGSCAAIGPDGRLWISHGFTNEGQRFADTRAYDFEIRTWTDETPLADVPTRRCLHACWWTDDGGLILYGGQTTGTTALGDLWRLTPGERPGTNAWSQLQPEDGLPPDRNLNAAARWGPGTVVFGGQGLETDYLADSWWLADDAVVMSLEVGARSPSARAGAELIADAASGRLLLFGGRDGDEAFGDLWQLILPAPP